MFAMTVRQNDNGHTHTFPAHIRKLVEVWDCVCSDAGAFRFYSEDRARVIHCVNIQIEQHKHESSINEN